MKTFIPKPLALAISAQIALTMGVTQVVAQEEAIELEEVVITGTRRSARSVADSPVPIDVVSGDDFVNQGATDLGTLLRNVVPSYNVNTQPISDAATIVRPANLRGLAPDHTLVLVNGKRRHRAAVIYWLGNGVADGAQGPDISVIPAIALKQVEVLRDGAAAQYGSDAIAGVMNFILKDDAEGATLEARYGEFSEGDGESAAVSGNFGLPFTDSGFANFSFEVGYSDPTDRSVQRNDAQQLIDAGNTAVANPAQVWGQPEVSGDVKLFANVGLDLGDGKEFYAFGNYAEKEVEGGFFFRNPNTRTGVYADGDGNRLIADLTDDGSGNCPTLAAPDLTNPAAVAADQAALAALAADPNCFSFNELIPGGFTPSFGGKTNDISIVTGVKGELTNGLLWDVSASLGRNEVNFFISNTVNASLGPATPREFNPGAYTQLDKNFNVDVAYPLEVAGFYSDLNIAGGLEYREEQFEITTGDQASFEIGPLADGTFSSDFSTASNGFPGFSPLAAGRFDRANIAAYIDLEADVLENLLLGLAARFEDFDDFGTTTNYKFSAHWQVIDALAFRTTWSTGFRAPTPGQSNAFNVSTEFEAGVLVNNGTIPPTNPVAVTAGGKALEPEESVSFSVGAILNLGPVDITVDYFNVELTDRITVSADQTLSADQVADLLAAGVTSAANLQNFRFFTNDYDTTTTGIDVVATYPMELFGGNTEFSLAYNYTDTEVDSFTPGVIDDRRIDELELGLPENRWNLTANHFVGGWRFLARVGYYDEYYDSEDVAQGDQFADLIYGDEYVVDAEVAYTLNDKYTVTVGAQNLFDEFPDENPGAADNVGNQYGQYSPLGFGGRFWYLRFRYDL